MFRALLGLSSLMVGAYLVVEGLSARSTPAPALPQAPAPGWTEV